MYSKVHLSINLFIQLFIHLFLSNCSSIYVFVTCQEKMDHPRTCNRAFQQVCGKLYTPKDLNCN